MTHQNKKLKYIVFDADDTLWENETHFRTCEAQFSQLMHEYGKADQLIDALYAAEIKNLPLYGYGAKGMVLCMIEVACELTQTKGDTPQLKAILELGKQLLQYPVVLLPHVKEVLQELNKHYRLVLATKGDLLDQTRKINQSGLKDYFCHIEIMNEKGIADYQKLLTHLNCSAGEIVMIGNSIKSDILPILELGGAAIHIPFHTTWIHEQHDEEVVHQNLVQLNEFKELLNQFA